MAPSRSHSKAPSRARLSWSARAWIGGECGPLTVTATLYRPYARNQHGDPVNSAGQVVRVGDADSVGTILGGPSWSSSDGGTVDTTVLVAPSPSPRFNRFTVTSWSWTAFAITSRDHPQWGTRRLVPTPTRYRWWTVTAVASWTCAPACEFNRFEESDRASRWSDDPTARRNLSRTDRPHGVRHHGGTHLRDALHVSKVRRTRPVAAPHDPDGSPSGPSSLNTTYCADTPMGGHDDPRRFGCQEGCRSCWLAAAVDRTPRLPTGRRTARPARTAPT